MIPSDGFSNEDWLAALNTWFARGLPFHGDSWQVFQCATIRRIAVVCRRVPVLGQFVLCVVIQL